MVIKSKARWLIWQSFLNLQCFFLLIKKIFPCFLVGKCFTRCVEPERSNAWEKRYPWGGVFRAAGCVRGRGQGARRGVPHTSRVAGWGKCLPFRVLGFRSGSEHGSMGPSQERSDLTPTELSSSHTSWPRSASSLCQQGRAGLDV